MSQRQKHVIWCFADCFLFINIIVSAFDIKKKSALSFYCSDT